MENNEIRIRTILFESWKIIKLLFNNNPAKLILLLIAFQIPSILIILSFTHLFAYILTILIVCLINIFISIFLMLVISKKINNQDPFLFCFIL